MGCSSALSCAWSHASTSPSCQSPAPGCFRLAWFSFPSWSPFQSCLRHVVLVHLEDRCGPSCWHVISRTALQLFVFHYSSSFEIFSSQKSLEIFWRRSLWKVGRHIAVTDSELCCQAVLLWFEDGLHVANVINPTLLALVCRMKGMQQQIDRKSKIRLQWPTVCTVVFFPPFLLMLILLFQLLAKMNLCLHSSHNDWYFLTSSWQLPVFLFGSIFHKWTSTFKQNPVSCIYLSASSSW